jgi:hypothetical protein
VTNKEEIILIARWIMTHVDETVVPPDEGNGDALRYNLIHLLREGRNYRRYNYEPDQDNEISSYDPVEGG